MLIEYINIAINSGACRERSCETAGLSIRTFQRWQKLTDLTDRRQTAFKPPPPHKLSLEERQQILELCNRPHFASFSVKHIVPTLADSGIYIASESSFYRVLREHDQLSPRRRVNRKGQYAKPKAHKATTANQLWSWDITFLASQIKGVFYYLYLIMDVYSRKIVGWDVHENQNDAYASEILRKAKLTEKLDSTDKLVLHSDNGSPMKGATMLATMQNLGVIPSFSRPSVSNDNPFSESLFKTLKYVPSMPEKPYENIEQAKGWVAQFVLWYNNEHKHSQIRYVTPSQRHSGEDISLLKAREKLYKAAKKKNPSRWSGSTRNWGYINRVDLNKYATKKQEEIAA